MGEMPKQQSSDRRGGATRYQTAKTIGRGASGKVFEAWDLVGERKVALKVFAADTGDSAERRQREAEAQGRLDHPSICEIYEVGTLSNGRGFIAMRLVDGEPLDQVASRLPLRQRVRLVREVADAVGHAHRAGLIHRDLKPGNLLVEEQEDGSLRPFVLDFGVVRMSDKTQQLTEQGQLLGTPGYVSPEQALGSADVDARSDVFSLGVVLYQVLTGELPFTSASNIASLVRALEHDPPPAHQVRREIPEELSHIVHKALEKDPRRRYRDAGALCRDLDRHLSAGTVSARGVGRLGRLVRRVERHPLPWALGAALLLLLLASAGWTLRNRFVAQQQTRDAERFARRSADIESQLRFLQLLPKRSIADDLERLDMALARLQDDVAATRGRARAAGLYAVGRGQLALGRTEEAVVSLRRARSLGFADPAGALALGRTLLEQARRELLEIDLLRDEEVRSAERLRVHERLRAEALPLLEEAAEASLVEGERLLAGALAALLLDEHDEARRLAARVSDRSPWLFEADLIRGDIQRDSMASARARDDFRQALEALRQEQSILSAAIHAAPSAPELRRRQCESHMMTADLENAERQGDATWENSFAAALASCAAALDILPSDSTSRLRASEVRWRRALLRLRWQGAEAARDDAEKAVSAARRLVDAALESGDRRSEADAYRNLGNALFAQAAVSYELRQPADSLIAAYAAAAEALEASLERAPGLVASRQSLGHAWTRHGVQLDLAGRDPRPSLDRAVRAYRQGLATGSEVQQSRLYNGICIARNESAYYDLNHPATSEREHIEAALDEAEAACRDALNRDPDYLSALSNLGLVHWTRVERRIAQGESPSEAAADGRATFERLLELAPDHVSGRNNFAGMVGSEASWRLDEGNLRDVDDLAQLVESIRAARDAVMPLRDRFPVDISIHVLRLSALESAARCAAGDPALGTAEVKADSWQRARQALKDLEAIDGAGAKVYSLRRAEYHRRVAECALHEGRTDDAGNAIRRGLEAIEASLAVDPENAEAVAEKARLQALQTQSGDDRSAE